MDYNDSVGETHRTALESNHDAQYESKYDPLPKFSVSTADTHKEPEALLPPTPKPGKSPRTGTWKEALSKRPTFQGTVKKINDWWLIELGACLVSLSAMLALILVIHHYDGKPLPRWPLRITIGTYIAVCSKVMSAMLVVPVVNSMSQYKWYMYQQSTGPLDAMGLVDNATRGTGGSVWLLLKHRSLFACLGALLMILSVAIESCFQEAVHTPQGRLVVQSAAKPTIARVQSYTHPWPVSSDVTSGSLGFDDLNTAEKSIKAAVYDGLFGNPSEMNASCPTGDCHWKSFMSLAVCNRCQDITPFAKSQRSMTTSPRLGNNTLVNSSTSIRPSVIGHTPWSLLDLTILGLERAYQCSMFWCVKEYDSSMVNGTVIERSMKTWSNDSLRYDHRDGAENLNQLCLYELRAGGEPEGDLIIRSEGCTGGIGCCYINFYTNDSYSQNSTFSIDYMTHHTLRSFLRKTLQGNITLAAKTSLVYVPQEMQAFATISKPIKAHSNTTSIEHLIKNTTLVDVPRLMDNITDSITVRMRQAVSPAPSNTPAVGTAYEMQTIIQFRVLWLLYPGILLLSTFSLLVAMMWMNHRSNTPLWKSDPNGLLFSGLAENSWNQSVSHTRLSDLDGLAEKTEAKLLKVDGRWRLVGTNSTS